MIKNVEDQKLPPSHLIHKRPILTAADGKFCDQSLFSGKLRLEISCELSAGRRFI